MYSVVYPHQGERAPPPARSLARSRSQPARPRAPRVVVLVGDGHARAPRRSNAHLPTRENEA